MTDNFSSTSVADKIAAGDADNRSMVQDFIRKHQKPDPSANRLSMANLSKGGESSALPSSLADAASKASDVGKSAISGMSGSISNPIGAGSLTSPVTPGMPPKVEFRSVTEQQAGAPIPDHDWRIKINCPAFNDTVIFPVLPAITFNYAASYNTQRLTHSNYSSYFYESSEVQQITIVGDFPISHERDGNVLLNTIRFFKATTKMYFGSSAYGGNPPPIVFLDGYGTRLMSRISCVVTAFTHTMPNDVDYINCGNARLPTLSQITVNLQPVISRTKAKDFNLDAYAKGTLPGFI